MDKTEHFSDELEHAYQIVNQREICKLLKALFNISLNSLIYILFREHIVQSPSPAAYSFPPSVCMLVVKYAWQQFESCQCCVTVVIVSDL